MKAETEQRELTPMELWDQLAVSTIKKQLAPNGYKKIYHGKSEVSNIQFLGKQTVNRTALISANLVRLYRENLKERLTALMNERDEWRQKAWAELQKCRFWELKKKHQLMDDVMSHAGSGGVVRLILGELESLKPSTPKPSKAQKDIRAK